MKFSAMPLLLWTLTTVSTQALPANQPSLVSVNMQMLARKGAKLAFKEGKARYDEHKQKQKQERDHAASGNAGLNTVVEHEHYSMTLLEQKSPDPWVTFAHDRFYLTFTQQNHITLWHADTLTGLKNGTKTRLWTAPPNTAYSAGIWAPELHRIEGRWFIYFTGADARESIRKFSRRIFVLGGPPADRPPVDGAWEFLGKLEGMPDQWAIDATVFWLDGVLYTAYSHKDWQATRPQQEIFIARMLSPTAVDTSSPPSRIAAPEHPWEKRGGPVNEGPEWIESPDGAWRGLLYSASGAGQLGYCEATLRYLGGDPLDPRAWLKAKQPIMRRRQDDEPPYGTGHGNWVDLDGQLLHVFHSMRHKDSGMIGRNATVQRAWWTPDGPSFGGQVGKLTTDRKKFAGDDHGHPRWDRF